MANEYLMSNIDFNIKVVEINNKFFFEGAAAARNIGYSNETLALKRHVWDEYKTYIRGYNSSNRNKAPKIMLTEPGLYQLILNANTDKAKKFQKWVLEEVLPSLRNNGGYILGQETLAEDERNKLISEIKQLRENNNLLNDKVCSLEHKNKQLYDDNKIINSAFNKLSDQICNIASNLTMSNIENNLFRINIG